MRCGFLACITINAKFTPVSFFRLTTSHDQCCGPKNCSVLLRLLLFLLGLFFSNFNSIRFFPPTSSMQNFSRGRVATRYLSAALFSLRVSLRPGNFANVIIFVSFLLLCSVKKRLHLINHSPPHVRTKF